MNYPLWRVPAPGLLIAVVGVVHVFVSHFAVGGGLLLVLAELKARAAADAALLGFVRALSRGFVLLTLVLGALTGVGIWFTIGLVQPQATSALVQTFLWAWAIEWTFFAVEIAAALVYYHGWDRLDARTHLRVGWVYLVASWLSLAAISGILSFMLTSGAWPETRRFADGFFNPTFLPTVALRTAAAVGLAGLYALCASAFVADRELKARVVRWSATRWIAPAALVLPFLLVWFLSVAASARVDVAETLGARGAAPLALLEGVFSAGGSGQPIVRGAARVALVASILLVAASLALAWLRARRFGRLEASLLMLLGLVSMGAGEWVREGLRKPWLVNRYLFVNGARVTNSPVSGLPSDDPFALEALSRRGVFSTPWALAPAAFRPGDPAFERRPAPERAALEAEAGRAVFELQCTACHTERGHLAVRPLVAGRSVAAILAVLDATARPVADDGRPTSWTDPRAHVASWRGRRMPPVLGTPAERRALAIHLARLGGAASAGLEPDAPPTGGAAAFERYCAACHGPQAAWPIAERLHRRSADELYEALGRLPQLREEMPPFAGSEAERRALAAYLGDLSATTGQPVPAGAEVTR